MCELAIDVKRLHLLNERSDSSECKTATKMSWMNISLDGRPTKHKFFSQAKNVSKEFPGR